MKKLIVSLAAGFMVTFSQAQDITDAVRYSTEELTGTARYRAMSGAFGALGGDLSSLNINPAGSAVFLNSFSTLTLSHNQRENNTRYFQGMTSNENSDVNFDQAGAVLVFNSTDPANRWSKFTLGVNYSQSSNFDDNYTARGAGSNSIDEYFLGYAQGIPLDLLETMDNETISDLYRYLGEEEGFGAQQAFLGYQGYIINPDSDELENTSYSSALGSGDVDQQFDYTATGLNGKFAFNFATEYGDFLYMGLNLNAHFLNYERSTRLWETNSNTGNATNEILFSNNLRTSGNGFSLQLGTIAKLSEHFRLGVAYDTPTWYNISEETSQRLESNNALNERVVVDPQIINVYPDYTLKTPGKITGSAAILFGTNGLISFDYSYKDFSNTELRPTSDPDFSMQNTVISENLKAASTYRVGGEYRIQQWSFRGGYRFEESPYRDETTIGDLTGYSLGLGYNFGNFRIDMAYDSASRTDNPPMYQVGLTNAPTIDRDFSNIVLSLSFGI